VLPGVLSANELRGHWVPRSRHGLGVSPGPARSLFVRRPPHLSMRFHPPSSFPPPSGYCGLRAAPRAPVEPRGPAGQPKSASHGVLVPHRDISRWRPPLRRESRPSGQVPSSTFLTSSTVYSATCLRGLVSSRCHVQGLPFRGLSLARSRTGFPRPYLALLALDAAACDQRQRPRLQGFAPRASAVSVETG
jgi:hypothetical protein